MAPAALHLLRQHRRPLAAWWVALFAAALLASGLGPWLRPELAARSYQVVCGSHGARLMTPDPQRDTDVSGSVADGLNCPACLPIGHETPALPAAGAPVPSATPGAIPEIRSLPPAAPVAERPYARGPPAA